MNGAATEVTTVALLARRVGMSRELFSRYWRDVHGVLAVRIPGFWSYAQYHVEPCVTSSVTAQAFAMDGFAEVRFRDEADRAGLAGSEVTPLILRDEINVFSRTLLYSLEAGASRTQRACDAHRERPDYSESVASYALVVRVPAGAAAQDQARVLDTLLLPELAGSAGLSFLRTHRLASGDPSQWNTTPGVDNAERGARNIALIQAEWADARAAQAVLDSLHATPIGGSADVRAYRVTARCAMVEQGRATHLGLRGLDVLRTIEEAGADNQKSPEVLRQVYGISIAR